MASLIVIRAKAGIQETESFTVAPCSRQGQGLDPRFLGGDG